MCSRLSMAFAKRSKSQSGSSSSSSSSSSSLEAASSIVDADNSSAVDFSEEVQLPMLATMAMLGPQNATSTEDKMAEQEDRDITTSPAANLLELSELDFLERRKVVAASIRTKREFELESESAQPPGGHYLPTVLRDASTLNRQRHQAAKVWAKAQERIAAMRLHKRKKKKVSIFGRIGGRWLMKKWKRVNQSTLDRLQVLKFWSSDLKEMECSFGSSMMLTFSFLRWVFLLNTLLATMWITTIVVPFLLHPPSTFSWVTFGQALQNRNFLQAIQGVGIGKSWIYFGGYLYGNNEQAGWYHTDYMYPVVMVASVLISLVAILGRITLRILDSNTGASGNVLYPFATLVFATWDFHVTSYEGATMLRRGIRMQLRELLADSKIKNENMRERPAAYVKRYLTLLILWPMLLTASAGSEYFLVTYGDDITDKMGTYAQTVLMALVNTVTPKLVKILVDMEEWSPAMQERVTIIKLYFLRLLNLSTIVYRSYSVLWASWSTLKGLEPNPTCLQASDCPDGFVCCLKTDVGEWHLCDDTQTGQCVAGCTENWVANELMKMIIITTLMNVGYSVLQGVFNVWWYNAKGSFEITDFTVDIAYMQALIWITSMYSPLAATAGCISNLITFIGFKFVLFRTCTPVQKPYSASRTSNLTYGMLLATLILSIIPIAIEFITASAAFCGPIRDDISMYTVLNNYAKQAPAEIKRIMIVLSNTWLLGGVIIMLVLFVILLRAQLRQADAYANLTKRELEMSRHLGGESTGYERLSIEDDLNW